MKKIRMRWGLFMSKGGVKMMKNGVLSSLSLGKTAGTLGL